MLGHGCDEATFCTSFILLPFAAMLHSYLPVRSRSLDWPYRATHCVCSLLCFVYIVVRCKVYSISICSISFSQSLAN